MMFWRGHMLAARLWLLSWVGCIAMSHAGWNRASRTVSQTETGGVWKRLADRYVDHRLLIDFHDLIIEYDDKSSLTSLHLTLICSNSCIVCTLLLVHGSRFCLFVMLMMFYWLSSALVICRLEVLHKVNNLVKEWIRDISIKKVRYRPLVRNDI